jgi:adenosylcobinamide-phosphate synthase
MKRALVFALGASADARFGDPPTRWHPVALVGKTASVLHRRAPRDATSRERYGLATALGLPLVGALLAIALRRGARSMHVLAGSVVEATLLDATCSLRTLLVRAEEVAAALAAQDLPRARLLCGTHLVSRDTSELSASEVAAATIESVSENLSDGVIAPWLAFAIGGVPGAVAYRVANTMDALWGYRTEEFAALGHAVARLDDVLNLLPARLTALAIAAAAAAPAYDEPLSATRALATWLTDARETESPNAGHPMAAMAGALGVSLAKRDAYILGAGFRQPDAEDIARAVQLTRGAATLAAVAILGALVATRAG